MKKLLIWLQAESLKRIITCARTNNKQNYIDFYYLLSMHNHSANLMQTDTNDDKSNSFKLFVIKTKLSFHHCNYI